MGNVSDYFEKNRYIGKYQMGDRVMGKYKGTPFAGTVGNDRVVSELIGPEVTIHLDLPLPSESGYCTIITVKPKDIRRLYEIEPKNSKSGTDGTDLSGVSEKTRRKST
jgi:hypothetical protein